MKRFALLTALIAMMGLNVGCAEKAADAPAVDTPPAATPDAPVAPVEDPA